LRLQRYEKEGRGKIGSVRTEADVKKEWVMFE